MLNWTLNDFQNSKLHLELILKKVKIHLFIYIRQVYASTYLMMVYTGCLKKSWHFWSLPDKYCETFSGNFHMYGWLKVSSIIMTPKTWKWFMLWWALATFVKGMKIRLRKNWLSILAEREVPQCRNWWWSGEFMINYDGYGFVPCMTCPTSCPTPPNHTQPHRIAQHVPSPHQ